MIGCVPLGKSCCKPLFLFWKWVSVHSDHA